MTRREKRWAVIVPLTLVSALLYGCTYNINYNKVVGLGCSSLVGAGTDKGTNGSGDEGGAEFARLVAKSLATNDDCTGETR